MCKLVFLFTYIDIHACFHFIQLYHIFFSRWLIHLLLISGLCRGDLSVLGSRALIPLVSTSWDLRDRRVRLRDRRVRLRDLRVHLLGPQGAHVLPPPPPPPHVPGPAEFHQLMTTLVALQQQQATLLERVHDQQVVPRGPPGYKKFRDMHPRTFSGRETPLEAEEWLRSILDIFRITEIDQASWVRYAKMQFTDMARSWWDAEEERLGHAVPWDTFKEMFDDKYFPKFAQEDMMEKFLRLTQGTRSVEEYNADFVTLGR